MHRTGLSLGTAALSLCLSLAASAQSLSYGSPIDLETARKAATAAAAEARKNHFTQSIAVVDSGGNLAYFEKLDDTMIASIDVALAKAKAANAYRRPTKFFEDLIANHAAFLGLPGAVPIEGGVPLLVGGKVVGAIGVSGGSPAQDGQAANAGAAALQNP